jgi:hypothetical protein
MKEQIIQLPNNFEVKEIKDGKIILVEKEKKLTYEDIAEKLFDTDFNTFRIGIDGEIINYKCLLHHNCPTNCTSRKQAQKLLATNKLMNVAKYLNGDWQPDWKNGDENKYYIENETLTNSLRVNYTNLLNHYILYFKSEELAEQAIEILGEETIKLALCTDY